MNNFNLLKVDKDICKRYKPNANVVSYFKSPLKSNRVIKFEDNTWMHIETALARNEGFAIMQRNAIQDNLFLNVFEKHVDEKYNRIIRLYTIKPIQESVMKEYI